MVLDIMRITGSPAKAAARLCNFVTSQYFLLPAHTDWLDTTVQPLVTGTPNSWVDIIGYASHRGSVTFNQRLSYDRCESIRKQIISYGATVNFPIEWGKGDSESTGAADNNDGYWRAADVYVYGPSPNPPPRPGPPPAPPSIPGGQKFRIRVFRAAGASIVIGQGDAVVFQIVDDDNKRCGMYYYIGAGLTLSIKGVTTAPGSIAGAGAFTSFTSTRALQLTAFTGEAEFFQDPGASVGSMSIGGQCYIGMSSKRLRAMPGVNKTVLDPAVIPVSTGKGFGAGLGSISQGAMSDPVIFKTGECCGAPGGICSRFP